MPPKTLPQTTAAAIGAPTGMRTGVVTKVDATGVWVSINGSDPFPCGVLGGVSGVAVGATVSIFKQDSSWLVMGATNGPGNGVTNSDVLRGSALLSQGSTLLTGLVSGSGEVVLNRQPVVTFPLNHLIQIRAQINWFNSLANAQLLLNIRDGAVISGSIFGSLNMAAAIAFDGYTAIFDGWVRGDGKQHILGLTVQNLATGSTTVYESAGSIFAAFDWGDSTGVLTA